VEAVMGVMKTILAIDPGPVESGFVLWDGAHILGYAKIHNNAVIHMLTDGIPPTFNDVLVIEKFVSYGMPIGQSTIDAIHWAGRFFQAWRGMLPHEVPRIEVKKHICNNGTARDSNIRQALIDRFEPDLPPRCRPRGILKGITKDCWQALALAVYWYDTNVTNPA